MKVSLITTVKDAGESVGEFLASVAAQTRPPDEFVVVDGGSRDGTVDTLRAVAAATLFEEPGANIARGRNVAIRAAAHDVIAVSDADCVLEPDWLERLLGPIEAGADVAMGFYRPIIEGFFQACMSAVNLPDADEIKEDTFQPSARSVAFRREAFEIAGGYPEWLDIGEDSYITLRWRELGLEMRLAADAVANWRLRPTLAETWKQYFRYARGDAIAGMNPERNGLRFAAYSGVAFAWNSRRRVLKPLALVAAAARAMKPVRRAMTRIDDPGERAAAVLVVPALMAFTDAAKMAGYVAGLLEPRRSAPS